MSRKLFGIFVSISVIALVVGFNFPCRSNCALDDSEMTHDTLGATVPLCNDGLQWSLCIFGQCLMSTRPGDCKGGGGGCGSYPFPQLFCWSLSFPTVKDCHTTLLSGLCGTYQSGSTCQWNAVAGACDCTSTGSSGNPMPMRSVTFSPCVP
jgi:hypothetical protein